jgi:hypothetical protein
VIASPLIWLRVEIETDDWKDAGIEHGEPVELADNWSKVGM